MKYQATAARRRTQNRVPLTAPREPRPAPEPDDGRIVRAAIHPSIGVARVGNSPDELFIGPEVDEPAPLDSYKDPGGALKRQASRFRVYGYNAAGEAVAELTAQNADVVWTAHLANTKAAWYQFQIALDIPEAQDPKAPPSMLRNLDVVGDDRAQLAIDPGARTIRGCGRAGPEYRFDTGTFFGRAVYLGELRTDEAGRLLVLGGHGHSAPAGNQPLTHFANNHGWHDDVSDGPVTATVNLNGRAIPVDPSWVVVAPPNYAPPVLGVRTLYDLLFDSFVRSGALAFPERTSFMRHVYPILVRMQGLEWVNQGFATAFGWGGRERLGDRDALERLASPAAQYSELRRQVFDAFRDWARDGKSPVPWPWIYGDSMSLPPISARQQIQLSATQMRLLERWAAGDFDSDLDLDREPRRAIEDVAVAEQPETLDRAALTHCLADAFHPGCEVTWPIRHASMFMAPFRIRHRAIGSSEPPPAKSLTPQAALAVDGPLYGQSPGSLSRWMAVPWQADTSSCRSGYDSRYDPYLPTFWPARVPNQVLTERDYEITVDEGRPLGERREAFGRRANWLRWLTPKVPQYMLDMVEHFGKFGVVETRPGPSDGAFPARLLVESEVGFTEDVDPRRGLHVIHVPEARDEDVAEIAINSAIEASPHPDEEIIAGYFSKVERFRR